MRQIIQPSDTGLSGKASYIGSHVRGNLCLKNTTQETAITKMNGQDVYMRVGTTEKGVTLRGIDTANAVVSTSLGMLGRGR